MLSLRHIPRNMAFFVLIGLSALLWSVAFYFACYLGFRHLLWGNEAEERKTPGRKALVLLKMIAFLKVVFAAVTTISSWMRSTVTCELDSTVYISQETCLTQLRSEYPGQMMIVSFLLIPALHAFLGVLSFDLTDKTVLNDEGRAWPVLSILSLAETIAALLTFFLTGFVYSFCVDFWRRLGSGCVAEETPWLLAIYSSYAAAFCGTAVTILMGFITYFVPGQKAIDEFEAIGDEAEKAVSAVDDVPDEEWIPFELFSSDEETLRLKNYDPSKWMEFKISSALPGQISAHPAHFFLAPRTDSFVKLTRTNEGSPESVQVRIQFIIREYDPRSIESFVTSAPKPKEIVYEVKRVPEAQNE
ncbi:hypothetical protein QR680_005800 [Steinernema hermaphroditum]|uniref:MSP domain-containing protein n=1 Tax=Steinernema hermaphroditum TaxID=289476 RepID=A0AA39HTD2_9BILA|nr:hypothetical protein QR680_005800 [Steinernema hermaphroditum]